MPLKIKFVSVVLIFLSFFLIGYNKAASSQIDFPGERTSPESPQIVDEAIQEAFLNTVYQDRTQIMGFLIYEPVIDHIQYADDNATALLWVAFRDPETGEVIETEPGLTIARSKNPALAASADNWAITLQSDSAWAEQLAELPEELLSEDIRIRLLDSTAEGAAVPAAVLTGYKLPWTAGLSKRVTNSIGHVYRVSGGLTSCPATCRYAYDFADGTMFPILAAKGGTVKSVKSTCPNFGESCTNYLILEDQSTIPTTYQVYYHLAYNSVPQRLRTVGAQVLQGEYIGDADDTGFSTGHHLHYHVYVNPNSANWSWGASVDFKFDDVTTNGGYLRTCAEAAEYPALGSQCMPGNRYTSGNTPANPPVASLSAPNDKQVITRRTVRVAGSASDDIEITRIQVLVNYDGTWQAIDDIPPAGNGPFAKEVDLCTAGVPDGPFALTVRVYDREGSQARDIPVRNLIKNASCTGPIEPPPVPACAPGDNQVALYAETDFRGACKKFDLKSTGGYTVDQLGAVGNNNTESIQVGKNVAAVLFDRDSDVVATKVTGRMETSLEDDASLSDNVVGLNTVSGLWVVSRSRKPDAPFINALGNQLTTGAAPTSLDSLVLAWEGGAGATSYDVILNGPGANWTRKVTRQTSLSIGNLDPGTFTLTVRSRNGYGTNSVSKSFTVHPASFPAAATRSVPFEDTFEAGPGSWVASGLWRHGSITIGKRTATKAWIYNDGADTAHPTWRAGDLTSAPIAIPANGTYYLRFTYYADVEDGERHWDQRRVQISDGGKFVDLYQLMDDKQIGQVWLDSGPISLAEYAGKTIRLRFHYDSIDEERNTGKGWMVDNIRITNVAPNTSCMDSDNNSPENAQPMLLGTSVSAVICPEQDIDYYRFTALAGEQLLVDINARTLSPVSLLDSYVYLLDGDGRSLIFENDDEQYIVKKDSLLSYKIQRTGTYYLKVMPWNYPVGSPQHTYELVLNQTITAPPQSVQILYPRPNRLTTTGPFEIQAEAVDFDGGPVAQVEFYWHASDWSNPAWTHLGTDTDGSDGWSMQVDPAVTGSVSGAAIYVQARSRLNGVLGTALWDLIPDLSTPVSQMHPLPGLIKSTAVQLTWTANGEQNDIARFELQYQENLNGNWAGWQNWTARPLPGHIRSTWFLGKPGASYRFRLRAIARSGVAENYPGSPEAFTTLAAVCTPDSSEKQGQSADNALLLDWGTFSPIYNFCCSGADDDVDWLALKVQPGADLLATLIPGGGGAAFSATLYNPTLQPIGNWQSADFQSHLIIKQSSLAAGVYFLEIKPLQAGLSGTDTVYRVWYGPGTLIYFPNIHDES